MKYILETSNTGPAIISQGSPAVNVPSLGAQNHQITDPRDMEECLWLMDWAYRQGMKDKARAIRGELTHDEE